ncbi:MAG: ABC transporter ATP-binding protein [Elusimicrobia bacterium]|nr:ABC transporter ATP-binding protein [Elusimicrobiota bacterium]
MILSATNLTKKFAENTAVNNLSFNVEEGEIFGLIGPDGSGKTTTLRLLCGVITATAGDVALPSPIGYMPQRFSLYSDLTVEENMNFFADMYQVPKKERQERMEELYEFSRLQPFKNRFAQNLSGGMQKKLGLSCCLIHTPKLLLLDEPTTGVDPVSRHELWDLLYRLKEKGVTIIVSTPYMDEAEKCTRVALMHNGNFIVCASPDKLKSYMKNAILEVWCADSRKARALFKTLEGVEGIYPFGDTLHMVYRKETAGKPEEEAIKNILAKNNIELFDMHKISPSFEDVFISLIEKGG